MRAEYQALYLAMQQARHKSEDEYQRARYRVMAHPLSGITTMPAYMKQYVNE